MGWEREDEGYSLLCTNDETLRVLFLWLVGWGGGGTSFKLDACSNEYSDAFSLPAVVPRPLQFRYSMQSFLTVSSRKTADFFLFKFGKIPWGMKSFFFFSFRFLYQIVLL